MALLRMPWRHQERRVWTRPTPDGFFNAFVRQAGHGESSVGNPHARLFLAHDRRRRLYGVALGFGSRH
jgi:hypothetical protein